MARAFSIETPAVQLADELLAARAAACQAAAPDHAALRARIEVEIASGRLPEEERTRLAGSTCPLCGCPVGGA